MTSTLSTSPSWQALQAHAATLRKTTLREHFAADAQRGERLSCEAAGIYLDYSKQHVDDQALRLLLTLAVADGRIRLEVGTGLEGQIPDAAARTLRLYREVLDDTLGKNLPLLFDIERRCDQFDLVHLPVEFAANGRRDLGIA